MEQIRQLDDGGWVVDFGRKWFRISPTGSVTKKMCKCGSQYGPGIGHVETVQATPTEAKKAKDLVLQYCLANF